MQGDNNLKVKNYMEEICSYIKYKEAHDEIKLELSSHIEEIIDDYIEEGYQRKDWSIYSIYYCKNEIYAK